MSSAEPESPFKPKRPSKAKRVVESDDDGEEDQRTQRSAANDIEITKPPAKKLKTEDAPKEAIKMASIFAKPAPKLGAVDAKSLDSGRQISVSLAKKDDIIAESSKSGFMRASAGTTNGSGNAKGKAPAENKNKDGSGSEHEPGSGDDDDEGEEELDDDEEEAQEGQAAVKLAAIFTKHKTSTADDTKSWKEGEPLPYAALVATFEKIEATTKRLEILHILTQFLLKVAQRDAAPTAKASYLLQTVYLCINRLCPDYAGLELGIGESLLVKAIAESTGRSAAKIKDSLKKEGDLGKVAMLSRNTQPTMFKPKALTVPFVFQNLTDIAKCTGNASQTKKVGIIKKLLAACQGNEAKFVIRSLEGKLRIGLAEKTLVVALAHAIVLKEIATGRTLPADQLTKRLETGAEIVKAVFSELPNYDLVIPALMKEGVDNLKSVCKLTPGVPLKPMLAKPTKAIGEVLDRFENKEFTCEYKYDGERAQVHLLEDGTVAVFSRNSENMSAKYPDLVEQVPKCIKPSVKSFVIDSEAVAFDLETKRLLPFQDLSRRKRKDVRTEDITVRVHLFAFDLLYLNGESLLGLELHERRALMLEHFQPVEGEFAFATSSDGSTIEEIQAFLELSVKDGCEGLMVKMLKTPASTYEPSRRSQNWLKIKKDYLSGVGDSLDLVVVGAYHGKGKRTSVYGAFLLACYDPDSENYQTICKIGTGFSEERLEEFYSMLHPLELTAPRGDVQTGSAKPDVWFEPKVVWEVLTADLSISPVYAAAQGLVDDRGISLRFPRFIKVRNDKDADEATSAEQVAEFYQRQATAGGNKKKGGAQEDYW